MRNSLHRAFALILGAVLVLTSLPAASISSAVRYNCKETNCFETSAATRAAIISNQRVAVQVGSDGRFNIGAYPDAFGGATPSSWDLSFRWPYTPWSSYTTIRIDGADYVYGSAGRLIESPINTSAGANRSTWQINDIKVTQNIQIVTNPQTSQQDLVRIAYTVQNLGSTNRSVGSRVLIDTEINYNDGAVYRVPNRGIVKTETNFVGAAIPDTIQSFFSISDNQRTAASIFKASDVTPAPDRLVLAQWYHLYTTLYDYTINPTFDFTNPNVAPPDSAYATYWNPAVLVPRAEQTYVTYYGLSSLTADLTPPLGLGVNGPTSLAIRGDAYAPNPFTISATVNNNSAVTVNNIQVNLNLPTELSLANGTPTQTINSLAPGEEKDINWSVSAVPQSIQKSVTYQVSLSATNAPSKTVPRAILLPRIEPILPLIFVPGIGGSYLDQGNFPYCNLWPLLPTVFCFGPDEEYLSLDISPNLVATDAIRSAYSQSVYEPLLKKLTSNDGGYTEATNGLTPYERCVNSTSSDNLYVFAYDWRRSNRDSAEELERLVGCVREKHPDQYVNILTHSMGGLVARRYILDNRELDDQGNRTHYVNKLVTIAAPWLGSPKFINVLRNGVFFDEVSNNYATRMSRPTIKMLVKSFTGAHELLPSKKYFDLGGRPVGLSNSYFSEPRLIEREEFEQWVTQQFPNIIVHNNDFHVPPQDDWRNDGDNTGVHYVQIYGSQAWKNTIETVVPDLLVPRCNSIVSIVCVWAFEEKLIFTKGDGTVPVLSASRMNGSTNLNPITDSVTLWRYDSPWIFSDGDAEHSGLTKNTKVQECVLKELQPATRPECDLNLQLRSTPLGTTTLSPERQGIAEPPAYRLTVRGVPQVTVTDEFGNTTDTLSGTLTVSIPNAVYYRLGELSQLLMLPPAQPYTATLKVGQQPLAIDLTLGTSTLTNLAVRYQDVVLPANSNVILRITPQGLGALLADTEANGSYETTVQPTAYLTGAAANDTTSPGLEVTHTGTLESMTVTITATDDLSGVQRILYSLDGTTFQLYTAPFTVDATKTPLIYVFADDNAANRSTLLTERIAYQLYLPLNLNP